MNLSLDRWRGSTTDGWAILADRLARQLQLRCDRAARQAENEVTFLESLLAEAYPAKATGHPRGDLRRVIDGIIYRMRTGVQWNRLLKQFGSDRTVHRRFRRFSSDGIFERLRAVLAGACDDLGGVDWQW